MMKLTLAVAGAAAAAILALPALAASNADGARDGDGVPDRLSPRGRRRAR